MSTRKIISIALLIAVSTPIISWYFRRTIDGSDEPVGMIALLLAGGFIYLKRDELVTTKVNRWLAAIFLVGYGVSGFFLTPMIQAVFLITAVGCLIGLRQKHSGVFGLLLISLPIMASIQFYAGYPLREIATTFADWLLSGFGIDVAKEGTALRKGNVLVFVDPPCAGINYLWMTGLLVFSIGALRGYRILRILCLSGVALMVAIFGNGIRVALLFIKESGMVNLPNWTHAGIGLLVFALLAWLLLRFCPKSRNEVSENKENIPAGLIPISVVGVVAILVIGSSVSGRISTHSVAKDPTTIDWPKQWQGEWLEPMPLTRKEKQFAKSFPGRIARFQAGDKEVIIKQVNRPTRKLHSITDCLRGAGWSIHPEKEAGNYKVTKQGQIRQVKEVIYSQAVASTNASKWYDVSEWFWDCYPVKQKGPWFAVVEIGNESEI